MAKKDPEVEFENVTKAQLIDDDGYEEGKSKEREMMAEKPSDKLSDNYKGGVLYKGKAKDYTSASDIINKKKAKVIPINIGPGKKKD